MSILPTDKHEDRASPLSKRPRVLVIDDLPLNAEVIGENLSDFCDVESAVSGAEGLALIEETLPDLILLDVMMPGMDGYAVCEALKRDPRTREIPVIFVTGHNDAESESRALQAGAVDFIHKPVNRDVVRARARLHLALKSRERELRELNQELEQRVEERTAALKDALIRAEAAHRAKSLFLANINHELRTPMNAILGLSELIALQIADPLLQESVDKIGGAGRQLLGIMNDIIEVADLQAGKIEIEAIDFALRTLLGSLEDAWRGHAEAKGLTLVSDLDSALPPILRGDPVRLEQILGNFLSNAVKFSESGRIVLRARLAGSLGGLITVRFEVEDQGIGIDADRQAAIFDIFEQGDNSNTRRYGGSGIGLAICKQLAELMGGSIGVGSAPEKGSLFWVAIRFQHGSVAAVRLLPTASDETAAPSDPEEVSGVDWDQVRQVFVPLVGLLAAGDIQAYMVWSKAGHLLEPILGVRAAPFKQAMDNFEFAAALEQLLEIRAAYPQLEQPRSG